MFLEKSFLFSLTERQRSSSAWPWLKCGVSVVTVVWLKLSLHANTFSISLRGGGAWLCSSTMTVSPAPPVIPWWWTTEQGDYFLFAPQPVDTDRTERVIYFQKRWVVKEHGSKPCWHMIEQYGSMSDTVASLALAFFVSFVPPCSLLKDDVALATGMVSVSS